MLLTKNIRTQLGQYRFLKELKRIRRKPEIVSFEDATKIGLLYDATDERDSEAVKNYVKSIRNNFKKDILAMGYVDKKNLRKSQYAQFGLDFFTRKDLNFQMIPNNPIIKNFINEKFDILINLNSGKCFPLRYISAMSRARFRVGRYNSNSADCFDMMVKLKGEPAIRTVIEEIEHFLRIIKSHEPKQA
jgi:hypothetical protein